MCCVECAEHVWEVSDSGVCRVFSEWREGESIMCLAKLV